MEITMAEPIYKYKEGVIDIAVFENTFKTEKGTTKTIHSMVVQRSYKDKNDEWQKQKISGDLKDIVYLAGLIEKIAFDIKLNKAKTDVDVPYF